MDAVTLALAKAYSDSQRLAYASTVRMSGGQFTVTPFPNEDLGGVYATFVDGTCEVKENATVVEIEWERIWYSFDTSSYSGAFHCGNAALAGIGDNTGEPFFVIFDFDQNKTLFIVEQGGTYNFRCMYCVETIHTIDPKFLPGAVLPVVELETEISISESAIALSQTDSVALDNALASNLPCVVTLTIADFGASMKFSALFNLTVSEFDNTKEVTYSAGIVNFVIVILKTEGGWAVQIAEAS